MFKPLGALMINDMDLIRQLTSSKNLRNVKKGITYKIAAPLIGRGILSVPTYGSSWEHQRNILDKGFAEQIIASNCFEIKEVGKDLVERITFLLGEKNVVEVNIIEEMLKTTIDVLGRVAFSYDFGSLKAKETKDAPLFSAFDVILNTLQMRMRNPLLSRTSWVPTEQNNNFNKAMNKLVSVVDNVITGRKTSKSTRDRDLLDILLLPDDKGRKLTDLQISENIRTMLFAGHDTTAAALSWSFFLLGKHPDVVKKIEFEFQEKFAGDLSLLTAEKLETCKYLNSVVLEVLRLYPSAGFMQATTKEFYLDEYLIPKGMEILILPYLLHRNPKYYNKPDEFLPERWLEDFKVGEEVSLQTQVSLAGKTKAYFPFSLGKRICVGRKLALLEIRVILLNVLKHFEVSLPPVQPETFSEIPYLGTTLYPVDLMVCFSRKNIS
eukprot:augustus_masked-scaffold_7-processed-gene-19.97-mRNA-1 protein AED:1.00 eAED:1.00 QI:0/-1/0/0/-1/1/1/0/436